MNFYKKITITIFSILVVFGFSAGISSAFIGPDPGQSPGTGSGLFYVDPDRNIGFGTESPSIGTNAEGSPWGYTFTVASSSNPGISLLNTSASGRHYSFYSHDSGSFGLFDGTAGEVRLRVTSNGNIGVGSTNAPQSLFHVFGTSQATSFTGSGVNLTNIDPQNFIAGSSFNSGNYAIDGSLGVGTSSVTTAPTNGLYVGGNVGIGASSPSRKLDVNGIIRAGNTGGTGGTGRFEAIGGSSGEAILTLGDSSNPDAGVIRYRNSDNSIAFDTNDSEKLRITSGGNVGIGTSTPPRLLSVDARDSGIVSSEFSNSGGHLIDLKSTSDYNGIRFYNDGNNGKNITYIPDGDYLQIGSSWSSGGEELVVQGNGNVGIGTTTTPSKLTVNGGIETLSGGVTFPDGTTQTTAGGGGGGGDAVGWDRDDNNGYVHLATSTDSVGIGDATPSAKLDVNGGIYGSILYDKDNDTYYMNPSGVSNINSLDAHGDITFKDNANYKLTTDTAYYGFGGSSDQQLDMAANGSISIDFDNNNNSTSKYFSFTHNGGTELIRVNETGNIDMNSNKITNLGTPTASSDATTKSYVDSTAGGGVPSGSDGQTLHNSGGSWIATNNLYNDGSSVGIGTSNPGANLEVSASGSREGSLWAGGGHVNGGTDYGVGKVTLGRHDGAGGYIQIAGDNNTGSGPTSPQTQTLWLAGYNSGDYLSFESPGTSDIMTIRSGGNVGIGDSSPSVKLDVNGSIYGSIFYDKDNTSWLLNPSGTSYFAGNLGIGTTGIDGAKYGSSGRRVQIEEQSDGEIAQLNVRGNGQGTGYIYVGQSSSYGGGITYNGDNTPSMPQSTDDFSLFRRSGGTDHEVLSWPHNSDRAEFRGIVDANGNSVYGSTFYDSNNTSYYSNPSGTSNINGLTVNGNWTLSGSAQADLDMNGNDITGVNKITVGTIDPLYKINGQKYATFVPDTIGLKTEIYGKADLQKEFTGKESPKFSHTIDFDQVEEGSDLWVFWKTINLKDDMSDMIVSLTPEGSNADIWYELDSNENQLVINSDKLATVSYHLVAPRHDSDEWPTKTDTEEEPSFIFEEGEWVK